MAEEQEARVFELRLATMVVPIIGVSPFLAHRFSEEAQESIAVAQSGAHRGKKPPRAPENEFELAQYRTADGRHGLPAAAFKRAVVAAVRYVEGLTMTRVEGALQIPGSILPFAKHSEPAMQADRVVIGRGTTSIAYRARYDEWSVDVPVRFQEDVISPEQLVNLFQIAGFSVGVGDWRPSCKGSFGMFQVAGA